MKIFKDIGIRFKILAMNALFILALIFSILNTSVCITNISSASAEVSGKYLVNMELMESLSSSFANLQRIIYAYCIADSTLAGSLNAEMSESIDEMDSLINELNSSMSDNAKYSDFAVLYQEYRDMATQIMTWLTSGQTFRASQMAKGDLTTCGSQIDIIINDLVAENKEAVANAVDKEERYVKQAKGTMNAVFMVVVILAIISYFVTEIGVMKPIKVTVKKLNDIIDDIESGQGDLTVRVNASGKNELGQLGRGINSFVEALQKIMGTINSNSQSLEEVAGQVTDAVTDANDISNNISTVMDDLTTAMTQMSQNVSNVNDDTVEINEHAANLSSSSSDLLTYTNEMQERASKLEKNAEDNKSRTSNMVGNIIDTLKKAIEGSKSVEQVNELTNEILSISSKTNLLALNASIEAARAGEAGKGFAVVADEIRGLADSSRETANNIQNINNMVVSAVEQLISSSNLIIDYVNDTILPDYDNFVASGQQYSQDSVYINQTVNQFTQMSNEITSLMGRINDSMNGISKEVDSGVNNINNAAESTNTLVDSMNKIIKEVDVNTQIAQGLKSEVDRFKKL